MYIQDWQMTVLLFIENRTEIDFIINEFIREHLKLF